jgi:hypothetical protein
MTISDALQEFYKKNNLSLDGGKNEDFFELKFKLFTLKLPNSKARKKVIYIHDIQHVLYDCNITWKGEAFIAGWEIGTKMWKHFPIGMMSLWAMGFSLLNYPKEVFKGYKTGINNKGIIDVNIPEKELLNFSKSELLSVLQKEKIKKVNWFYFLFWSFTSVLFFAFPFLFFLILILTYII